MPSGVHLTREQIDEIVELYETGKTGPEIARQTGITWSAVVKVVCRELGITGSPDRPVRRPPPNKYQFTPDQLVELVQRYRDGEGLEALAAHFHCATTKLVEELGRVNEPIKPTGRPRVVAPEVLCPVCQELIPAKRFFYGTGGVAVPPKSCGKDECEAALAFGAVEPLPEVPRGEIRRDKGGWTPAGKAQAAQRQWQEERLLVERLPVDLDLLAEILPIDQVGEYQALFELAEDTRGSARPGAQGSIWGDLSRVPVYMRLIARGEGHAAVRLLLLPGESVFDRFVSKFFRDKEQLLLISRSSRPLLAWRCACPQGSSWILDTVIDLPEEVGVYGACATCGACALQIEHIKED